MTPNPNQADGARAALAHRSRALSTQYGALLDSAPDGLLLVDEMGLIVLANTQAEKMFGYSREELQGRTVELLMPLRFRDGHTKQRDTFAAHPSVRAMGAGLNLVAMRRDGCEFPVDISLSPVKSKDQRLVIAAVRDITDRKRIEMALQEKNMELEVANRELEAFSYSISHDLRAPLRAIAGYAGILARDAQEDLSGDVKNALGRICENVAQMGRLIDGLMALSSLGREAVVKARVDASAIARSVANELLKLEPAERRIDLKIDELPPCQADGTLLRQVFANLLSNAVKYTRHTKSAVIRIGCEPKNGVPVFFVRDNGAGFDMAYADKLFRVFQRLHSARQFEGTGVGLAIVQRIVHRHGGRIWAEAMPGQGATFHFTLGG